MCVIRGATTTGAEAISPAGSLRRWSLQGRWPSSCWSRRESRWPPCISNVAGIPDPTPEQYEQAVLEARSQLDSVGGGIRCAVTGLPAGLGAPDYGENVEGIFSQYLFAVPAVKAVGFGDGVGFASLRGSQANDSFYMDGDTVKTRTNHSRRGEPGASPTGCRWSSRYASGPPPPSPSLSRRWIWSSEKTRS